MEKLLFIDYIKLRLKGRRMSSPMGDLLDDMERDIKTLEDRKTMAEISSYIEFKACSECWDVFKRFRSQYRKYCRDNNFEQDAES